MRDQGQFSALSPAIPSRDGEIWGHPQPRPDGIRDVPRREYSPRDRARPGIQTEGLAAADMVDALQPNRALSSVLLIELGTLYVSAVLCDRVANRYRFAATGRAWRQPSENSPLPALGRAIRAVESAGGRQLLRDGSLVAPESPDGIGCDTVLLSGGRPLCVAAMTLGRDSNDILAKLDPFVADVVVTIEADVADDERHGLLGRLVTELADRPIDLLLVIAAGSVSASDAPAALASVLKVAQSVFPDRWPSLLLAAPSAIADQFKASFRPAFGQASYRAAQAAPPTLRQTEPARLSAELQAIWQERQPPSAVTQALAGALGRAPLSRLDGLRRACLALATSRQSPVWLAEVSEADVVVVRATPNDAVGAIRGLDALTLAPADVVAEWKRRPWLAPADRDGVDRQRILATQAIAQVARHIERDRRADLLPGLVIGRGVGLTQRLPAADAAAAVCLGIGLTGASAVALDRHSMLAGVATLLESRPDVAADLLPDSLDFLGEVVIGRTDDPASAVVQVDVGNERARAPGDVRVDELTVLAAEEWANAVVTLIPSRSVDVGSGAGKRSQVVIADGDVGGILTITRDAAPRKWLRHQEPRLHLPGLLRRPA